MKSIESNCRDAMCGRLVGKLQIRCTKTSEWRQMIINKLFYSYTFKPSLLISTKPRAFLFHSRCST